MNKITLVCFLVGLAASVFSTPVDEDAAKEVECMKGLANPSLDFAWFTGVKKWYFPYWNKLDSLRMYADILDKEVKDLTEEELQDSCVVMDDTFTLTAFNQTKTDKFQVKFDDESHINIHFGGRRQHGDTKAGYHIAMTDNDTYQMGITCWEDNQASWLVASTTPTLDPKIEKEILDYVKTLGFKTDLFVQTKYDTCF